MLRCADGKLGSGFQVKRVRRVAGRYLLRQLEAACSRAQFLSLIQSVREHGGGKWTVSELSALPENHPANQSGKHTYTHAVTVLYKPTRRPGVWECVFGLTAQGNFHLWSD